MVHVLKGHFASVHAGETHEWCSARIMGKNGSRLVVADPVRWYAIYVRSRCENKVSRALSQKAVEAYLPLVEEVRLWSDRKKKIEEPSFKGYVFVMISLQNRLPVLQTDGVVRSVGIRNQASAIPDEEIEWIRIALDGDGRVKK